MRIDLTKMEQDGLDSLKSYKPLVYDKCIKYPDKVERGESIAILQFQYDYGCNFKCEHCAIKKFQGSSNGRVSFDPIRVKQLADQAHELGLAHIVITGGEPLTFKDFDQIIEAIGPERFYITSDTNGWHLTEEKAKHLKAIGVDKIQLSIDSLDAKSHDDFRRAPGSHERTLKAIDAAQSAGLSIIIQTVVTKSRCRSHEFIDFIDFLNKKNVGVFVTFAKPVGAWEGCYDEMVDKSDMEYMKELENKYKVFTHLTPGNGFDHGCIAVKRMVSVTKYGDILPCPYMHTSIGNFFKEPLKDILERGMNIKWFGERIDTCMMAEDKNFVKKYVEAKIYGKPLPVPYKEVFDSPDDYINGIIS